MLCEDDFPLLKSFDYHEYFKEQIIFFYFNLSKKTDSKKILDLSNDFSDVLKKLKKMIEKNNDSDEYIQYLVLFYRMIGHTRDIFFGKGEHDISYMLLMVFYDIYPILAIYSMHRFVRIMDDSEKPFGSWRDIKYFCDYLRKNSPKKENHGFIQYCIDIMNSQLNIDYETWRFSICSRNNISNVSKWIPREHKKFHWLFNILVIDWIKKTKPFLINNTEKNNSYTKAILKAKRLYRRRISLLNKALDTTQIKQCSQNWDDINPKKISSYTLMKQRTLLFGNSEKYKVCSKNIREHFERNENCSQKKEFSQFSNYYPISFFVKEALRLSDIYSFKPSIFGQSSIDKDGLEFDINSQKQILNKQWKIFSKTICINGFDNVLPIVDASFYMQLNNLESFYTAIGFAILIAERSNFGKRILVVDYQSTWINLDNETEFTDIIENIYNSIKSNTNTLFNINSSMELIVYSLIQSKSNNRYIENMKLVFFSCFHKIDSMEPFVKMFSKYKLSLPIFIFWNLSTHEIIPSFFGEDSVCLLSGMSNGVIHNLCNLLEYIKKNRNGSVYHHVLSVLNNKRYDNLEKYIYSLCK